MCLLRDLQGKQGIDFVKKYTDILRKEDKADAVLYENRLKVCKGCNYLSEALCQACGCYVELRAAAKVSRCPYKKW